ENSIFIPDYTLNPNNQDEIYANFTELYKKQHPGSWTQISDLATDFNYYNGSPLTALCIAPNNHEYIYVAVESFQSQAPSEFLLFKTTSGGYDNGCTSACWTEMFPPNPEYISSIAVSPYNENEIWIAYKGYSDNNKIKHFDGNSWADYSTGLPTLPVNNIIFNYGSDNGLFVATDNGVYYRDATMNQWETFKENLPNVNVSELEINYGFNKVVAGTFGRGLWESQLPCNLGDSIFSLENNQTWKVPMIIDRELVVGAGKTLTVESNATIHFLPDAKIIIKPGGKLILNGGTLTNSCGDLWGGVEVWGDPLATQTDANQGVLEIYNSGTIENAETGIRVGAEGISNKGGGIVRAYKFNLLNNETAVIFDEYPFQTNASYFWEGDFNFTDHLGGTGELSTFQFVYLSNVHHVEFEDCNFTNNSNLDHEGTGIRSSNAIVDVKGHCTAYSGSDCIAWDNTYFENLEYGIDSRASNTTDYTDVRNTVFADNYRGIYLSGITNARVTSNNFELNGSASSESYGLYLDECDQYWVEDNHFEKGTTENTHAGIGIYVNESGDQANEIYLNSFDYVEYCVVALGNNRDGRRPETGLVFRCNDYDNTLFDEVVVYDGMLAPPTDDGIAALQGANTLNPEDMAGNLFYYNNTVSGDYDDINNQSNHFYYYYSNNAGNYNVEPLDYTTGTVSIVPKATLLWIYENACPSNLESTGGGGSEGLRTSLSEAQAGIESTEAVLAAIIDGGDTETLNTEVENSTPPETSEIYNELMAESPNLSEIVVESSIEKEDVLPNAMIRDVMVANPHTSTSLQLLERLDERTNPMPAWMKAQILAGRSIQSLKTELEGELATYRLQKARAINGLANLYKSDPEITNVNDSLLALYQADNSLHSRYMQAWLYLQDGQFQQGENVMAAIPVNFDLSGYELTTYQNMNLLYTMVAGLMETGNGTDSLNPAQIAQLHIIAGSETGFASVYARNLLLALHELDYQEPVTLPNNMKSTVAEAAYQEMLNAQSPSMLEVYPNPSKDFVIIGYQVNEESPAAIEIRDVSGKLLKTLNVRGHTDQVTVNTHNWKAGVYMLSLIVNEQLIETTKFTLVK
ncbi:MAG: T9SS type A sorting domain-containing protein, partial [Bacteroidales bacterium]|nr:T9SS type A sorting domain-containing protein [Bacteroidales bacterium]